MTLTIDRAVAPTAEENQLRQSFALLCFITEENLRKVSNALSDRDLATLRKAPERNHKIERLQGDIEDQILRRLAETHLTENEGRFLLLMDHLSRMMVRLGEETVRTADLASRTVGKSDPGEMLLICRLLNHAISMVDLSMVAFLEGKNDKCLLVQERASTARNLVINNALHGVNPSSLMVDSSPSQLRELLLMGYSMVEQGAELAEEVDAFYQRLEKSS